MADDHQPDARAPNGAERQRPDRDNILAGLARMRAGQPDEDDAPADPHEAPNQPQEHGDDEDEHDDKPAKPAKPAPAAEPDEEDGEAPEEDSALEEKPAPVKPKADPDFLRREAQLRKQEQRARAQVEAQRREIDKARAELKAKVDELEAYNKLKARAKYDPAGVLQHLGLSDEDWDPAARQLYSLSPAAKADPKNRAAVESMTKERELRDTVSALQKRLDERDKADSEAKEREQNRVWAEKYMAKVEKMATAATAPLAAHYLAGGGKIGDGAAKVTTRARTMLRAIAAELAAEGEGAPEQAEVLAEYERRRKEELDEIGYDYSAIVKGKPAKVGAKPAATTGTTTPSAGKPKPMDAEAKRDALVADLGRFRRGEVS